jgi:hypothetical protein
MLVGCSWRDAPKPLDIDISRNGSPRYDALMATHSPILERVIRLGLGDWPAEVAGQFLRFDFSEDDRLRYLELSDKAQQGTLAVAERAELEEYLDVNDLLMVLQATALASLTPDLTYGNTRS